MRTIDPAITAAEVQDALTRFPIGARVRMGSNPRGGTVRWRPFVCDAGTVSLLVAWDDLPLDSDGVRQCRYVRVRDLFLENP